MRQPTKHYPHPEGKLARSLFGAAFMSDTKWRKLFQIVHQGMPGVDRVRVKFIGVDELKTMRFPPSLQCPHAYMDPAEFGPTELRSIEWLEIDADISAQLAAVGQFPLTVNDGRSRVTGYGDPRRGNSS